MRCKHCGQWKEFATSERCPAAPSHEWIPRLEIHDSQHQEGLKRTAELKREGEHG